MYSNLFKSCLHLSEFIPAFILILKNFTSAMFFKNFWNKYKAIIKDKYFLTAFIFFVWLMFFDENNLLERRKLMRNLNALKNQKEYYLERIQNDTRRLNELKTNTENLEKFAREEYLMKKPDEDIFLIIEKN